MLVMVSPTKEIVHAVIHVNAVVFSHFLWITLAKSVLDLLKRVLLGWVFLFFICLFGLHFLYFAAYVAALEYVCHM